MPQPAWASTRSRSDDSNPLKLYNKHKPWRTFFGPRIKIFLPEIRGRSLKRELALSINDSRVDLTRRLKTLQSVALIRFVFVQRYVFRYIPDACKSNTLIRFMFFVIVPAHTCACGVRTPFSVISCGQSWKLRAIIRSPFLSFLGVCLWCAADLLL